MPKPSVSLVPAQRCSRRAIGLCRSALAVAALAVTSLVVFTTPAYAVNKTVNGITVDVNLPQAQRGVPYTFAIEPTGGGGAPYTFSFDSGSLPNDFSMTTAGVVSGSSCTAPNGSYNFVLTITSATGTTATFAGSSGFSINMTAGPSAGCAVSLGTIAGTGTVGAAYSQTISATGGATPYTFSIQSGSLPNGLSLNGSTGAITGAPTIAGSYSFAVRAADSGANTGFRTYAITISVPTITVAPGALPNGSIGTPYAQTLTASGGTGPYSFAVTSGALPDGLSLDAESGEISGTPTSVGASSFTIVATDAFGSTGSQSYAPTIAAVTSITIAPTTLPSATNGTAYSQTLMASGGTGPYTFAVTSGALPIGLTLDTDTGEVTGTPTTAGNANFTVTATDSLLATGSRTYAVTTNPGDILVVSPGTLSNGTNGTAYAQTLLASGGTGPYTFAVTSGALPTGLTLDTETGEIGGTPTTPGNSAFTIGVTDALGNTGSQSYAPTIAAASSITIAPNTLPSATNGSAYSQTLMASGGTGPYTFAVTSGALPTGLTLDTDTGEVTGTPTNPGDANFTVTATDSLLATGSQTYAVTTSPGDTLTVSPGTLPSATNGAAYSQTLMASGGTGPYTFAITSGALPAGLTLDSESGEISGAPTTSDDSSFTIGVTDALGNTGAQSYALTVAPASSITIAADTPPSAASGTPYSQTLIASGGTGPYTFAVTSGALPPGLTLDTATGEISGTPTTAGTFSFTVGVTDALGNTGTQSYAPTIAPSSSITFAADVLPNATNGTPYSQTLAADGGTGPYSFEVTSGALPTGLTLDNSSGEVSGTPTTVGSADFTVTATDSLSAIGSQTYALTVNPGDILAVSPGTLPNATNGAPYSQTLIASGGTGPYRFAVTSGALPAGLTLDTSTGEINGTSTTAGDFSFTLGVTDALGNTGSRSYSVTMARQDPSLDAELRGAIDAQFGAAARFAEGQTANVARHLQSLDLDDCADSGAQAGGGEQGAACDRRLRSWIAGSFEVDRDGGRPFSRGASTGGFDWRLASDFIVGAAVGLGIGSDDFGHNGTDVESRAVSATAYFRWGPLARLYIDGMAGWGATDMATDRYIAADGGFANGARDGNVRYGTVGASYDAKLGAVSVMPYARYEVIDTELDAYRESGSSAYGLVFAGSDRRVASSLVGVRTEYVLELSWVRATPFFDIERRSRSRAGYTQGMSYVDDRSSSYRLRSEQEREERWSLRLGADLAFGHSGLTIEYGTSSSGDRSFDGGAFHIEYRGPLGGG